MPRIIPLSTTSNRVVEVALGLQNPFARLFLHVLDILNFEEG